MLRFKGGKSSAKHNKIPDVTDEANNKSDTKQTVLEQSDPYIISGTLSILREYCSDECLGWNPTDSLQLLRLGAFRAMSETGCPYNKDTYFFSVNECDSDGNLDLSLHSDRFFKEGLLDDELLEDMIQAYSKPMVKLKYSDVFCCNNFNFVKNVSKSTQTNNQYATHLNSNSNSNCESIQNKTCNSNNQIFGHSTDREQQFKPCENQKVLRSYSCPYDILRKQKQQEKQRRKQSQRCALIKAYEPENPIKPRPCEFAKQFPIFDPPQTQNQNLNQKLKQECQTYRLMSVMSELIQKCETDRKSTANSSFSSKSNLEINLDLNLPAKERDLKIQTKELQTQNQTQIRKIQEEQTQNLENLEQQNQDNVDFLTSLRRTHLQSEKITAGQQQQNCFCGKILNLVNFQFFLGLNLKTKNQLTSKVAKFFNFSRIKEYKSSIQHLFLKICEISSFREDNQEQEFLAWESSSRYLIDFSMNVLVAVLKLKNVRRCEINPPSEDGVFLCAQNAWITVFLNFMAQVSVMLVAFKQRKFYDKNREHLMVFLRVFDTLLLLFQAVGLLSKCGMHSFTPFHVGMWLNKKIILYHVRTGKSLLLNLLDVPYFLMVARPFMFGRFGYGVSFLLLLLWVCCVNLGGYFIELKSRNIFLNTKKLCQPTKVSTSTSISSCASSSDSFLGGKNLRCGSLEEEEEKILQQLEQSQQCQQSFKQKAV